MNYKHLSQIERYQIHSLMKALQADIKSEPAPDKRTSLTLNYAVFNSCAALQLFSNCIGLI